MKVKYPELIGKCKTCLYKCIRCEDVNFKGVYRCNYYIKGGDNWKKKQRN